MWLGRHRWFPVLLQGSLTLRRLGPARTWGGCRGQMAETFSTGAEAATELKAPAQQNGDASGDARGERPAGSRKPVGWGVEPAREDGKQTPLSEEQASVAASGPGKRKKRRDATRERVVPPPKKRRAGVSFGDEHFAETSYYFEGGLRKVRPYYFDFQTYCKGRWVGHSLLHVFSTEFRAQPLSYYEAAVRAGRLHLNEEPVQDLSIMLKDNDFLRNRVHRHEPPVTAEPVRLLAENEDVVVVDKPSSIPVHPCGRFRHNTVIFILGKEHQLKELHPLHRLDRLTSGVLMFAKTAAVSERIHEQVRDRQLEKEYVCRVEGEFPTEEVTCKEPILVVSYKVGVCRVDTRGKPCETVFQRLSYNGHSSVVRCRPLTGRTHQIRVHLQFLGHPILNDPIYNSVAWGPSRGRGGHIPKTDEELLRDLVAEHQAKQSLDVLDLCEGDLPPGLIDSTAPSSEVGKDHIEELAASAQKMDGAVEATPQDLDTMTLAPGKAAETDVVNQEIDPLCAECRLVRQDPLPQDLVMFLHALCYKGPGFEYFSPMPAWAQDDWQED
ncbi:pseudouridylate synthase RPUSD2 [Canis lupus baileyi]|uniref:Pseudouridylate synthase RPUSD2 n=3 Tax=Canis lupus TaxID=9612 RepID=A0A8C0PKV5_CANLF|nr:pseudouridylate synthase RPUSD2 [Canis lupus dingo]XP_038297694.1 RNA pseudouridylate synthase domain-containing protein 2 [Canis lupus familiaris]XP_038435801.1 RNA pseudouridylate synthase domain-containing protein 2 [Canis lupus familiaris]XP_544620.4 RNA pseudouridylate synthase domain-containing protein 2 [Canis lupus familiaris]